MLFFSLALTCLLLVACLSDLKAFRIPNAVPFALIALFLIKAAAISGITVWPGHVVAFGLTFGLGILAFALGLIGGGDAKLMAALALWFGMDALPSFLAITAVGGGALALILVAVRHVAALGPIAAGPAAGWRLLHRHAPVPYALPITLAALWLEWR
ncbi:MAG: prepilin peptidase [Alphaproteobacteria bacterium]|nr:prepilin peptidase [Alphaproteobacteria bacterium]